MLATVQQITVQQPIHWEAVLITAIPALTGMVAAIFAAYLGTRNKKHIESVDKAVNGAPEGAPTLRESVEQINTAVNGTTDGQSSIQENVQALTERRDLDPSAGK